MEVRLLIAFVLMGSGAAGQPVFHQADSRTAPNRARRRRVSRGRGAAVESPKRSFRLRRLNPKGSVQARRPGRQSDRRRRRRDHRVDTERFHVVFSNRGAVVRSWILKDYKDDTGKPLELVYQPALAKVPAPFSLEFPASAARAGPQSGPLPYDQAPTTDSTSPSNFPTATPVSARNLSVSSRTAIWWT